MSKKIMKRGLALGALMAFVITGSVWAATADGEYCQLKGKQGIEVSDSSQYSKHRVVGGWATDLVNEESASKQSLTSDVNVTGDDWDMVIGGHYASGLSDSHILDIDTTNVVIDTTGIVTQVIGGSAGSNTIDLTHRWSGSSNLLIKNGNFGKKVTTSADECPALLVVGGDLIKFNGAHNGNDFKGSSSINKVNTTIEGGTFDSAIIGGSAAIEFYGSGNELDSSKLAVSVDKATTQINGGTFNHVIAAGGIAYGYKASSNVKESILNIAGAKTKINCDIYAGGLSGGLGVGPDVVDYNTVGSTEINIDGTQQEEFEVKNIYGTSGVINFNVDKWEYSQEYLGNNKAQAVNTTLSLTNVKAQTVDIPLGSISLRAEGETGVTTIATLKTANDVTVTASADGEVNDAVGGDLVEAGKRIKIADKAIVNENKKLVGVTSFTLEEGEVAGRTEVDAEGNVKTYANEGNTGIADISAVALMSWRAETNDMNKRMGELRNANGEHGVWVRMVRGESEYGSVNHQYNQYQLGYDEKLSVDPSWTVGAAYTYTDAESSFSKGSGENTHKGVAIYGSKLNDDGSFIDLIAKYSRLEHDFDLGTAKGDYSTNGYSVSAEYGKRLQQGNGLWIEPQVELTYGKISSADYMVGKRNVAQDGIESLVGRVGFSLGKDIKQGNVYARASYLYDFEGETEATFSKGSAVETFKQDLGGGWWEVGVGTNINLSKATYIYADVEKTFGGEVDTDWQWNLGVRYSF